ncbi:MAG: hypothetical protein LBU21_07870, partial [Treponema sp.]|nr:hypothetical protein [Treponema sp.]
MSPGPLLLVPRTGSGYGGGHLVRCGVLARELRSLDREAWIYLPSPGGTVPGDALDPSWVLREGRELREHLWDWIVLDYFKTPPALFEELAALAPVIAIDEGGPCRGRCDFTLDLLPGYPGGGAPNYFLPALLPLPKNRRPSFFPEARNRPPQAGSLRVLVSFGAEDPRKLTVPFSLAFLREARKAALFADRKANHKAEESGKGIPELTAVFGGLYDRNKGASSREAADRRTLEAAGIRVLSGVPSLREHLAGYDLLVT